MLLKLLRKQNNLTATEVARKAGISQGYYSHIENGSRRMNKATAEKIGSVLGVSHTDVMKASDSARTNLAKPKTWIWKLHLGGKPILRAFKDYLEFNPDETERFKQVPSTVFEKWVLANFEESLKAEIAFTNLGEYIKRITIKEES
jgi:transcriptional regulator with XRE-family HTH domain